MKNCEHAIRSGGGLTNIKFNGIQSYKSLYVCRSSVNYRNSSKTRHDMVSPVPSV